MISFLRPGLGDLFEVLFKQHCVACHLNGGNTITTNKTLHQKDREANGVKTADDIIPLSGGS